MNRKVNCLLCLDTGIATLTVGLIFTDVILQVISRLTPGNAISWTVEMGELLLATVIWLGIGLGVQCFSHVRFDLLLYKMPKKMRKYLYIASNIIFAVFLFIMAVLTLRLLDFYILTNARTTVLRLPKLYVKLPMLIGCIVGTIRLLIQSWLLATSRIPIPTDISTGGEK
jgi:TRAP-type C4-dicarboxylate transport system permease small subunit